MDPYHPVLGNRVRSTGRPPSDVGRVYTVGMRCDTIRSVAKDGRALGGKHSDRPRTAVAARRCDG